MKSLVSLCLFFIGVAFPAQAQFTLSPNGFNSVEIPRPDKPTDKLIENIRSWAVYFYQNSEFGYDVYEVSDSGMKISSTRNNGFFYRNLGETYYQRIKYTLKIEFLPESLRLHFSVNQIYTENTLTNLTIAKFFNNEGKLKDDYLEAKPSLEKTANNILKSFVSHLVQTN